MSHYLSKEKKEEIFAEYGGLKTNTGSIEGQIALSTFRIQSLAEHLAKNKKDNVCRTTLLGLVGKRRKKLAYYKKRDIVKYRELIEKLGIRK